MNETMFFEEQETRYAQILKLFAEEKGLLTSQDDTIHDQLKNLQKYLDLKDKQLNDLRKQLHGCDDKLKLKELQITRSNTTIQHLNEQMKELQDQNAALENKVTAYFKFSNHQTPDTPLTPPIYNRPASTMPTRNRGGSEYSADKNVGKRRGSVSGKGDGDNLLKQQEYLADFARLRAQREKERLEAERKRRKMEQDEALKKQKAAEIQAAA